MGRMVRGNEKKNYAIYYKRLGGFSKLATS
jgi:hypothetical protein